jgi:hypothetical protein
MKNIYLIPTDKPSRLIYNDANQLCYHSNKSYKNDRKWMHRKKFNICITNDEKIKELDWFLNIKSGAIGQHNGVEILLFKDDKKIILTTDPDLIKDGVQAIDDDFLEWFVKNPSCESVEVERLDTFKKTNEVYVDEIAGGNYYEIIKQYKIIIPQEKPEEMLMSTCVIFTAQEEIKPEPNFYEKLKEYFENTPREKVLEDWNKSAHLDNVGPTVDEFIENSQEQRLKEAANSIYPNDGYEDEMYCDLGEFKRDFFIEGAKWQAERMYSEEEVYNLLCSMPNFFNMTIPQQIKERNNWFEQFKKKKYERRNSNNTFIRN